ncbi:MAG: hypothetical protein SVX38_05145 [Chloroflexota bacterium]|nr:hypothetical protein [Chloroflexota bacterium]
MSGPADVFATAFNIVYLVVIWLISVLMGVRYSKQPQERRRASRWLVAAVLSLALGDSFHLVARAYRTFTGVEAMIAPTLSWVGFGLFATSFTITLFYLFTLLYCWQKYDLQWGLFESALVVLFVIRLCLLLFPQNDWDGSTSAWKLYRNIPFTLAGLGVAWLLWRLSREPTRPHRKLLAASAVVIVISFACYIGTLVLTGVNPIFGMLMLPKTVAYVLVAYWFLRIEFYPTAHKETGVDNG